MKDLLIEISKLAIQLDRSNFTHHQKILNWLGADPALIEDIQRSESRLGVNLPSDYKNFLLITNGFFTPNDATEPTFEMINKIDHLKNIDAYLLEIYNEEEVLADVREYLNRAIVVGGIDDEQYFFLIPPDEANSNWQYWKFASWLAGERRYESLEQYFISVLDFLKSCLEQGKN